MAELQHDTAAIQAAGQHISRAGSSLHGLAAEAAHATAEIDLPAKTGAAGRRFAAAWGDAVTRLAGSVHSFGGLTVNAGSLYSMLESELHSQLQP